MGILTIVITDDGLISPFGLSFLRGSKFDLIAPTRDMTDEKETGHGDIDFGTELKSGQIILHGAVSALTSQEKQNFKSALAGQLLNYLTPQKFMIGEGSDRFVYVTLEDKPDITEHAQFIEVSIPFKTDPYWQSSIEHVAGGNQFIRNSPAYKQDGTQVASDVPRWETGLCGQGVMIEEWTTNIVTQANLGARGPGVTAIDTGDIRYGQTVKEVTMPGSPQSDWGLADTVYRDVSPTTKYTVSVDLKHISGTNNVRIGIIERDTSGTFIQVTLSSAITVSISSYIRYEYTLTTGTSTAKVQAIVNGGDGQIFRAGAVQLEQKSYETSFINGTRSAETLTIPTAGVFNKGNWTVEFTFEPTSPQVIAGKYGWLWRLYLNPDNFYQLLVVPLGQIDFGIYSNGTHYYTFSGTEPILSVGNKYRIGIKGNGSTMALFIDGVKIREVTYVEPVGDLPENMYLGCTNWSTGHADGIYDDFCVSGIARLDADMATRGASTDPLPVDEYTTYKMSFDNTLIDTLINLGTMDTPVIVEIQGPATSLAISVGSSVLMYSGSLGSADKLTIDTDKKTVKFNSSNALALYSGGFPVLPPGQTLVSAAAGGTTMFRWRNRWL